MSGKGQGHAATVDEQDRDMCGLSFSYLCYCRATVHIREMNIPPYHGHNFCPCLLVSLWSWKCLEEEFFNILKNDSHSDLECPEMGMWGKDRNIIVEMQNDPYWMKKNEIAYVQI